MSLVSRDANMDKSNELQALFTPLYIHLDKIIDIVLIPRKLRFKITLYMNGIQLCLRNFFREELYGAFGTALSK